MIGLGRFGPHNPGEESGKLLQPMELPPIVGCNNGRGWSKAPWVPLPSVISNLSHPREYVVMFKYIAERQSLTDDQVPE